MKKIISTMLAVAIICGTWMAVPSQVSAAEVIEESVSGSLFTDDEESNATVYAYLTSILRGVYLLEGSATITRPFTGIAGCSGSTTANFAVSQIVIGVTLQRYVNGSWVSVTGWTNSATNSYFVNLSKTHAVTGGYYYRVQTTHIAATESTMTATNGIWFS